MDQVIRPWSAESVLVQQTTSISVRASRRYARIWECSTLPILHSSFLLSCPALVLIASISPGCSKVVTSIVTWRRWQHVPIHRLNAWMVLLLSKRLSNAVALSIVISPVELSSPRSIQTVSGSSEIFKFILRSGQILPNTGSLTLIHFSFWQCNHCNIIPDRYDSSRLLMVIGQYIN